MDTAVTGNTGSHQQHHASPSTGPLFVGLQFTKKGSEITEKAQKRIARLRSSVEDRNQRLASLCNARNVQPAEVLGYVATQQIVGDVLANPYGMATKEWVGILVEARQLLVERRQTEELEMLCRNIGRDTTYTLSFADIAYLEQQPQDGSAWKA